MPGWSRHMLLGGISLLALDMAACGRRPADPSFDPSGAVAIRQAAAWPTAHMATLGFRLLVRQADTLRAVSVAGAAEVSLHQSGPGGRGMIPVGEVPLVAGREVVFNEGHPHVMIMGLASDLRPGDTLQVTFRFARAGDLALAVPVLRYTEAVRHIGN